MGDRNAEPIHIVSIHAPPREEERLRPKHPVDLTEKSRHNSRAQHRRPDPPRAHHHARTFPRTVPPTWRSRERSRVFAMGGVRASLVSHDERAGWVQRRPHTLMLSSSEIIALQEVKAQTVMGCIKLLEQPLSQHDPVPLLEPAFKHRVLDSNTEVLASVRDAAQATRAARFSRCHIVADENDHSRTYRTEKGGYASRSPRRVRASNRA